MFEHRKAMVPIIGKAIPSLPVPLCAVLLLFFLLGLGLLAIGAFFAIPGVTRSVGLVVARRWVISQIGPLDRRVNWIYRMIRFCARR